MADHDVVEAAAAADGADAHIPKYEDAFPALPSSGAARAAPAWSGGAVPGAVRSSTRVLTFTIPADEKSKTRFGDASKAMKEAVKKIMEKTKTTVELTTNSDGSLSGSIRGKADDTLKAKKAILSALQNQTEIKISIPEGHLGMIIGKQGAKLKELQDDTATSIHVPKQGETPFVISILGTAENAKEAARRIQEMSLSEASRDRKKLPIVKAYHQLLCGADNANLKRMQEMTGATIHVPPPNKDEDGITVTGEVEAVARAVEMLTRDYERLRSSCGEVEFPVDRSKHKYVIGPQGKFLKEVLAVTGVVVEVPSMESTSDKIIFRGPKANLPVALRMVRDKANSQTQVEIKAPHWLHRHIIGPKGATVQTVTKDFPSVHVDFPETGDEIGIEGPTAEVTVVKAQLEAMIAKFLSEMDYAELKVDPALHARLIGKGGAQLQAVQTETNTNIRMPPSKSGLDLIRIEGPPGKVAAAKKQLEALVTKIKNQAHVDVIIPRRFHSMLIGAGGAAIRELVATFNGINVDIPDSKEESDIIVIRGDRTDVMAAEKWLQKRVKELMEENHLEEVPVFKQFHRNIIGKGGATIKQIMEETNTRIKVPSAKSDKDSITIVGRQKDVEEAKRRVLEIQNEMASIVTEELSISPKLHAFLKGKPANAISQECGGVAINFPKDTKSDRVTIKGPKEDVEPAKARLMDLAKQFELNSTTEEVKVKKDHHRHLIGRGGAALTKLQDETGCRFIFPTRGAAEAEASTITLLGSPEACAKARAALERRVADLENVVEDSVLVPRHYHKEFLANRSQFLRELAEEFSGVQVTVPKKDDPSDNFVLKGNKEDVVLAIERILEHIEELQAQVTLEFVLPHKHHRTVIGPKGANLQELTATHNVNIKFPERSAAANGNGHAAEANGNGAAAASEDAAAAADAAEDDAADAPAAAAAATPADIIKISGRKENCEAAWADLQALVPIQEVMEIDTKLHRLIIGKGGAGIKVIMDSSKAFVRFPEKSSHVTIKGVKSHVAKARALLEERVAELAKEEADRELRSFSYTVPCDAKHHRTLIGAKGAAVEAFRKQYDVQLNFPKNGSDADPNSITVVGYEDKVLEAVQALATQIEELDSKVQHTIEIHPGVHARVIGQRGANIREIQARWGVRINFPKDKGSPTVTIEGTQEACESAADDLLNLEQEFIDDVLEQEEMKKYEKRPEQPKAEPARQQQFAVRNAPWNASDTSEFPSLGGSAPRAANSGGAWGRPQ